MNAIIFWVTKKEKKYEKVQIKDYIRKSNTRSYMKEKGVDLRNVETCHAYIIRL